METTKHKVSELEGVLLDEAVSMAGDVAVEKMGDHICRWDKPDGVWRGWSPSTDWRVGGPIIDRDLISLRGYENGVWTATLKAHFICGEIVGGQAEADGHTPLIAAMRAYVASKSGEYVELPC